MDKTFGLFNFGKKEEYEVAVKIITTTNLNSVPYFVGNEDETWKWPGSLPKNQTLLSQIVNWVPQEIIVLGTRKKPIKKLIDCLGFQFPKKQSEIEGTEWMSISELVKIEFPIKVKVTDREDNWKRKVYDEFFIPMLDQIEECVGKKYHIAKIDFGVEKDFENFLTKAWGGKLSEIIKSELIAVYGEKSTRIAVI